MNCRCLSLPSTPGDGHMKTCTQHHAKPLYFLLLTSSWAGASGIYVDSQNAVGVGNANTGTSALAEDASTIFFNPAGMTRLGEGQHFSGMLTFAKVDTEFKDEGSTPISDAIPLGARKSDVNRDAWVPALYYAKSLSDTMHIGLGVSPTFGNLGEWDNDFIGRYQGSDTTIEGLNINPSLSLQLGPQLSLGFGVNYLYLDAELISKTPIIAGGTYVEDGTLTLEGTDGGWGYNVGLLLQATPNTRVGLSYRSTIKLDVKGSVKIETSALDATLPGLLNIEMPDMASLGVVHGFNDQWEGLLDLSWYGWSTISAIEVRQRTTGEILRTDELRFDNGVRTGLGLNWKQSPQWTWRAGVALDSTVADQPRYLSVRFPDSDRLWVAIGGRYNFSPSASLDFGYSHAFVDDARIARVTEVNGVPTAQVVRGEFSNVADLFALQWNQRF